MRETPEVAQIEWQRQRFGIPLEAKRLRFRPTSGVTHANLDVVLSQAQFRIDRVDLDTELALLAAPQFGRRRFIAVDPVDAIIGILLDIERAARATVEFDACSDDRHDHVLNPTANSDVGGAEAKTLLVSIRQSDGHWPPPDLAALRVADCSAMTVSSSAMSAPTCSADFRTPASVSRFNGIPFNEYSRSRKSPSSPGG